MKPEEVNALIRRLSAAEEKLREFDFGRPGEPVLCSDCGEPDTQLRMSLHAMGDGNGEHLPRDRYEAATIVHNYCNPGPGNRSYWRRRLIELVMIGLAAERDGYAV